MRGLTGLTALVAPAMLVACSADAGPQVGDRSEALISDAVHSAGKAGFYFLAPLVPEPTPTGIFESRLRRW